MNNNDIPQGPREFINGSTTILNNVLKLTANTACAFTALVYEFPHSPASAAKATTGTLGVGQSLYYVKSISITTGTCEVVYKGA